MANQGDSSSSLPSGSHSANHESVSDIPGQDDLDAQAEMPFSLRRPKDFKAGLSSGMKTIGKGVLAGAVGMPITSSLGAMGHWCLAQGSSSSCSHCAWSQRFVRTLTNDLKFTRQILIFLHP